MALESTTINTLARATVGPPRVVLTVELGVRRQRTIQKSTTSGTLRIVVVTALAFAVPNLVMGATAKALSLTRAPVNVDYLVPILVWFALSRSVAALVLVFLMFADGVASILPAYFLNPNTYDAVFWLETISRWPRGIAGAGMGVILGCLLGAVCLARLSRRPREGRLLGISVALALVALMLVLDWLNGSFGIAPGERARWYPNLAASPGLLILKGTMVDRSGRGRIHALNLSDTASGRYLAGLGDIDVEAVPAELHPATIRNRLPQKLLLVVVESLGLLSSEAAPENVFRPLRRLGDRYDIETGTLVFHGATLQGEMRELTWSMTEGKRIQYPASTLPRLLAEAGMSTVAAHGYSGGMYDRITLYPEIGFGKSVFLEDMRRAAAVDEAGTLFRGASDEQVARLVRAELLAPGKRFVYWLTLSGHVPVDMEYALRVTRAATSDPTQDLPAEVLAHQAICSSVIQAISEILADSGVGACDAIIVGDHAVPFMPSVAKQWYRADSVPYAIVRHRSSPKRF